MIRPLSVFNDGRHGQKPATVKRSADAAALLAAKHCPLRNHFEFPKLARICISAMRDDRDPASSRGVKCQNCGGTIVIASQGQLAAEISLPCEECGLRAIYAHTAAFVLPVVEIQERKQQQSHSDGFGRHRSR